LLSVNIIISIRLHLYSWIYLSSLCARIQPDASTYFAHFHHKSYNTAADLEQDFVRGRLGNMRQRGFRGALYGPERNLYIWWKTLLKVFTTICINPLTKVKRKNKMTQDIRKAQRNKLAQMKNSHPPTRRTRRTDFVCSTLSIDGSTAVRYTKSNRAPTMLGLSIITAEGNDKNGLFRGIEPEA
jgi:hypothetical protein